MCEKIFREFYLDVGDRRRGLLKDALMECFCVSGHADPECRIVGLGLTPIPRHFGPSRSSLFKSFGADSTDGLVRQLLPLLTRGCATPAVHSLQQIAGLFNREIRELLGFSSQTEHQCSSADDVVKVHIRYIKNKIADLQTLHEELGKMIGNCPGGRIAECRVLETLDSRTSFTASANCA